MDRLDRCNHCTPDVWNPCDCPGRDWSARDYLAVCYWLDVQQTALFGLCVGIWHTEAAWRPVVLEKLLDILQEFHLKRFARVIARYDRKVGGKKRGCCLFSWVVLCFRRFAQRRIFIYLRREGLHVSLDAPVNGHPGAGEPRTMADKVAGNGPPPDARLMEMELRERLEAFLATADPVDAEFFRRLYMERDRDPTQDRGSDKPLIDDASYQAVIKSMRLTCSVNAMRTRMSRLKRRLRPFLVAEGVMS